MTVGVQSIDVEMKRPFVAALDRVGRTFTSFLNRNDLQIFRAPLPTYLLITISPTFSTPPMLETATLTQLQVFVNIHCVWPTYLLTAYYSGGCRTMTSFIDYHWKVDDARGQRDGPDYNAERSAARARINVVMAAAKQRKAAQRHQAQASKRAAS